MDLFLPVAAASNMTANKTERQAVCSKRPCAEHSSCSSCTQNSCMWCSNLALCIDTNAYVASFPYGQCMDWTTKQDKCNGQCGLVGGGGVGGWITRCNYGCVCVCVCVRESVTVGVLFTAFFFPFFLFTTFHNIMCI